MSKHEATMEAMSERLKGLMEGLDPAAARSLFEELIDDYCAGVFGVSVVGELKRVKLAEGGRTVTIQPLVKGRAMLISAYGFKVKSESECKCGRAFLVLDENNKEDHVKESESRG